MTTEPKIVQAKITGIGEIEVSIMQIGKSWWLKEIEDFVTKSDEKFYAISRLRHELKVPIHFQRALQAFVNHILTGSEEQKAHLIRTHFRNWINSQNGSLQKIISTDGYESNNGGNTTKLGTAEARTAAIQKW